MSSALNAIVGLSVLLVVAVVTNVLCWLSMYWGRADRPWHWTVLIGSFAYHPWLNRQERRAYKWGPGVTRLPERDLDSLPRESFIPPEMATKTGRKVTP